MGENEMNNTDANLNGEALNNDGGSSPDSQGRKSSLQIRKEQFKEEWPKLPLWRKAVAIVGSLIFLFMIVLGIVGTIIEAPDKGEKFVMSAAPTIMKLYSQLGSGIDPSLITVSSADILDTDGYGRYLVTADYNVAGNGGDGSSVAFVVYLDPEAQIPDSVDDAIAEEGEILALCSSLRDWKVSGDSDVLSHVKELSNWGEPDPRNSCQYFVPLF